MFKLDFTIFKRKKENLFVFGLAFILCFVVITIAVLTVTSPSQSDIDNRSIQIITPTIDPFKPPIRYDLAAEQKSRDREINRQPLSASDQAAKDDMILKILKGNSGVLYDRPTVRIIYIKEADWFQAEILTTNIRAAKSEANIWLRNQGLSQEAICKLPVMFYLNYAVVEQFKDKNILFSPLPNGCN